MRAHQFKPDCHQHFISFLTLFHCLIDARTNSMSVIGPVPEQIIWAPFFQGQTNIHCLSINSLAMAGNLKVGQYQHFISYQLMALSALLMLRVVLSETIFRALIHCRLSLFFHCWIMGFLFRKLKFFLKSYLLKAGIS